MKSLILLISFLTLNSCLGDNDIVFKNEQFKSELDSFLKENNKKKENVLHLLLADEENVFEEVKDKNNQSLYLIFYYSPPESCVNFYKSFNYKGKLILLYNASNKIKFYDLIDIKKESIKCNEELLLDGFMDVPEERSYYFDSNNKLIEIKDDGTLRKVE